MYRTAILSLVLIVPPALAAEPEAPKAFPGGGVLAPSNKVAYVPSATGGTDAVELATGKVLWSAKDAAQPLAATAEKVFVQSPVKGKVNQVTVKVLDAESGKLVRESDVIALPDWASVAITHGRTFRSAARPEKDGLLYVWEARAFYAGGAAPPPEVEEAARKSAQGAHRVSPETGKVEAVKKFEVKNEMFPPVVVRSTVGTLTFTVEDRAARDGKNPFKQRRLIVATDIADKRVWEREIYAPPFLAPPP